MSIDISPVTEHKPSKMSQWFSGLPTVEAADGPNNRPLVNPAEVSDVSTGPTRRRVVQGVVAFGGALALGVLDGLSGIRLRSASAEVGDEYLDCANYDSWQGYDDDTEVCVGAPYSYLYCGNDGWFRNESSEYLQFWPVKACGASLTKRNAWQWTKGDYRYRCADGRFRYRWAGSWRGPYFRICSQFVGDV